MTLSKHRASDHPQGCTSRAEGARGALAGGNAGDWAAGTGRIAPAALLLLAVLSGGLLALAFPYPSQGWLAWVALVPLLVAVSRATVGGAFFLGWIAGLVFFGAILDWLRLFGEPPFNTLLWLLAVAIEAIFIGAFAVLVRIAAPTWALGKTRGKRTWEALPISGASRAQRPFWLRAGLAVPAAWVVTEWVRCTGAWGFPWGVLGESQADWPAVIQCADLGGVWLVSFLVAWGNAVIASLVCRRFGIEAAEFAPTERRVWQSRIGSAWPFAALILAALLYGQAALRAPEPEGPRLKVAVIQGNVERDDWQPSGYGAALSTYGALTRQAMAESPDLVVWPETVVPGDPTRQPLLMAALSGLARQGRCFLLVGAPHWDEEGRLQNAALLIDPEGRLAGRYEKVHLVPFGEYIPFRRFLPFLDRFPEVIDQHPGDAYRSLPLNGKAAPGDAAPSDPSAVAAMICFESAFPQIGRAFVRDGAGLLAILTSDAAFDRTSAAEHHARKARFRAVETRRWTLQSATTGISLAVDPKGRERGRVLLHQPGILQTDVTVSRAVTLYARLGDWLVALCALGLACAVTWRHRRIPA